MFPGDWKVRDVESGERACSADRREGEDMSTLGGEVGWGRVIPGDGQLARLVDTLKK